MTFDDDHAMNVSMPDPSLNDLLSVAIDAAYAAGKRTLAYFNTRIAVELKADHTPVTCADRESEQLIRDYIQSEKNLDYIDFWDAMLGPDSLPRADLFVDDGLHNNAAGYKIRADIVRPNLKDATTGADR